MAGNNRIEQLLYKLGDYFSALLAWLLFFVFRKYTESSSISVSEVFSDTKLWFGLIFIPLFWMLLYSVFDKYKDIYRLSRVSTLKRTIWINFIGVFMLFFTVLIDDTVLNYISYLHSFVTLFFIQFFLTGTVRMVILTRASRKLKQGKVSYNTIIVGGDKNGVELYEEIISRPYSLGHKFLGFIDSNGLSKNKLEKHLQNLGMISDLPRIIEDLNVEEAIIAVETKEHNKIKIILDILFDFSDKLLIKVIPNTYDIMVGKVKMQHIYGAVLIEIQQEYMPRWEGILKRMMDVFLSLIMGLVLVPLIIYIIIRIKLESKGPILYAQERIGKNGNPFQIFKFRSMNVGAESNGPQLSSDYDPRVTQWGKVMRKWRIDEIPQFWNVIKGEMSLVGPRPERKYYIDKIMTKAPHYKHLLKVRPGITSWGQVKYGYASNLKQMIQRLKYDILYIENMSISLDLKILFYTVLVLFQGKGK